MTGVFMGNLSNGFSKSSKGSTKKTFSFENYFTESIHWLEHCEREMRLTKPNFTIQHYWKILGEKRLIVDKDFLYLDGFARDDSNETYAYEYLGCFHHFCSHCGTNPEKQDLENQRKRYLVYYGIL